MLRFIEQKQAELKQREEQVKRDEERIAILKKDVEERIAHYHKLLARLEEVLRQVEQEKDAKIESLVKAYEAMPAEDAAARITALDRETALLILSRMKSKKAGAVMAAMPAARAAQLTRGLAALEKVK